jgi:hypothetical protein
MSTYKIKRIFKNSITITYRRNNGDLQELEIFISPSWDKNRIEKEIYIRKKANEDHYLDLKLDQYFLVGDELEFLDYDVEKEHKEEEERIQLEHQKIIEEENQRFLDMIIEYRNTPVDYKALRWHEYPTFEEQLDALYWMRQGVMEPIQELDKKIKEIKEKYSKNKSCDLTNGDLDNMFPESRPTNYLNELRSRNIQADFL